MVAWAIVHMYRYCRGELRKFCYCRGELRKFCYNFTFASLIRRLQPSGRGPAYFVGKIEHFNQGSLYNAKNVMSTGGKNTAPPGGQWHHPPTLPSEVSFLTVLNHLKLNLTTTINGFPINDPSKLILKI